ncbi:MAG: hypothetical protein WC178_01025 [Candidatus Paceibacterota bacterium]
MPEINNPEGLRLREIEELEKHLAEKKAAAVIENGAGQIERRMEISQENLPEMQTQAITPTPATQNTQKDKDKKRKKEIEQDTKSITMMDETRKMETLVAIALDKGINHSIEVANNLRDPYILDLLHDKLIGELHEKLVKEKRLKEI